LNYNLGSWAKSLLESYPNPTKWQSHAITKSDLKHFLRLWLLEGIPFAFQKLPMLYQYAREDIANQVGIAARNVTLIGSARTGYSLAPPPKFGRAFSPMESDLDVVIISSEVFTKLADEFNNWRSLYEHGVMLPTEPEKKYWPSNALDVPKNLERGFIDTQKIPNRYEFETTRRINGLRTSIHRKLHLIENPLIKKITFRVYKNHVCAERQMMLNIESCLQKQGIRIVA